MALGGAIWSFLLGFVFFAPFLDAAIGARTAAVKSGGPRPTPASEKMSAVASGVGQLQ